MKMGRSWPPERVQMAAFIALLKAQPQCFKNSRPIVGDPWKDDPYGYCCTDGKRAFLAIHNACWKDSSVALKLNSEWGLANGRTWDIYRWHPAPAQLTGAKIGFDDSVCVAMRPFEVVLLEVVPVGQAPSLDRKWKSRPIPAGFAEPARSIDFSNMAEGGKTTGRIPLASKGGTLVVIPYKVVAGVSEENFESNAGSTARRIPQKVIAGTLEATIAGQPVVGTQVWSDKASYHASWQAWRIPVGVSSKPQEIELTFTSKGRQPEGLVWKQFFIPVNC